MKSLTIKGLALGLILLLLATASTLLVHTLRTAETNETTSETP
jgi:hypothetical protein